MHRIRSRKPWTAGGCLLRVAVPLAAAAALTAALLPGSGSAVALVPPNNTAEPSIVGAGRSKAAR